MGHSDFSIMFWRTRGKMTSKSVEAKFHYDAAGSVCRCAVHQFRSRVQNERERRWRKAVHQRGGVLMQDEALHVLSDKTCISTPEYRAHDSVYTAGWFGTSAPKKIIQVVPSEYVHFTPFGELCLGAFPELALYRFLALPGLPDARKCVETLPRGSRSLKTRKNLV